MKKFSIIILLLTCKTLFGQELTLKDLNVEEFYSIEEAEDNIIKNSINMTNYPTNLRDCLKIEFCITSKTFIE